MRRNLERSPKQRELIDRGLYLRSAALGTFGFCTRSAVDIVVLTGDYITYDLWGRYRRKVTALLGGILS